MRKIRYFVFEPFRLDVLDERLWERAKSVRLGHKALALLECLVRQPGRLVTKDELLAAAWPETAVCEAVLTTAMREDPPGTRRSGSGPPLHRDRPRPRVSLHRARH